MQGHQPGRNFANACACSSPELCISKSIFPPGLMHMKRQIPALNYLEARTCASPKSCRSNGITQPEVMHMEGRMPAPCKDLFPSGRRHIQNHVPARNYANAGAYFSPDLCICKGIFQPAIMQIQWHIPARNYRIARAYFSP